MHNELTIFSTTYIVNVLTSPLVDVNQSCFFFLRKSRKKLELILKLRCIDNTVVPRRISFRKDLYIKPTHVTLQIIKIINKRSRFLSYLCKNTQLIILVRNSIITILTQTSSWLCTYDIMKLIAN